MNPARNIAVSLLCMAPTFLWACGDAEASPDVWEFSGLVQTDIATDYPPLPGPAAVYSEDVAVVGHISEVLGTAMRSTASGTRPIPYLLVAVTVDEVLAWNVSGDVQQRLVVAFEYSPTVDEDALVRSAPVGARGVFILIELDPANPTSSWIGPPPETPQFVDRPDGVWFGAPDGQLVGLREKREFLSAGWGSPVRFDEFEAQLRSVRP